MGQYFWGKALGGKAEHQHWHDNQPATDAKQPGQHPGAGAKHKIQQQILHNVHRCLPHNPPW